LKLNYKVSKKEIKGVKKLTPPLVPKTLGKPLNEKPKIKSLVSKLRNKISPTFKIFNNRIFLLIIGAIVLIGVSFYAGIKVEQSRNKIDSTRKETLTREEQQIIGSRYVNGQTTDNSSNTANQTSNNSGSSINSIFGSSTVLSGKITTANTNQIELIDKAGVTKKLDYGPKSVVISEKGEAIAKSGLKPGYSVIILLSKGEDDKLVIERIKITSTE
jgi:hypothetical protein